MGWPAARAAIVQHLNGITADAGTDFVTETLVAYEFPPAATQGPDSLPYAYVIPPRRRVTRVAGGERVTEISTIRVAIVLGPIVDREQVSKRYDAWVDALSLAFDDAVSLDGTVDVLIAQQFEEPEELPYEPGMWGFEMHLETVFSASTTFSA